MLALGLGGWLVTIVGPQQVFVIYGLIGLAAIPLALTLPRLRQTVGDVPAAASRRWTPSALNLLFFVVGLGAEGVFTATLSTLLADIIPVTSAVIGAGLLLAGNGSSSVVLSFASGPIIDRLKARRVIVPCSLAIAAGLLAIALGSIYIGAVVLIFARAAFAIVAPVIAAQQSSDRIGAIAAYATWSDCGLAAGAFIGIVGMNGPATRRPTRCSPPRRSRRSSGSCFARKQFRRQRARDRPLQPQRLAVERFDRRACAAANERSIRVTR